MTVVTDYIADHVSSKDVIVIGISPAPKNRKPFANCTLLRLDRWMKQAGQPEWSFHNAIPDIAGSFDMKDVDSEALLRAVKGKQTVIALGSFVERVCKKHGIDSFKVDHPSPRNRNFNDAAYEPAMVKRLKQFLKKQR